MTVVTDISRVAYAGDGATISFAVPFPFIADEDLRVFVGLAGGGEAEVAFSASGAGNPGGGEVTLQSPPGVNSTVTIYRDPRLTQQFDYVENGRFPAESHELGLDKLTMIAQRTRDLVERAPSLFDADTDGSGAFNARGNRLSNLRAGAGQSDAATLAQLYQVFANVSGVPDDLAVAAGASVTVNVPADYPNVAAALTAISRWIVPASSRVTIKVAAGTVVTTSGNIGLIGPNCAGVYIEGADLLQTTLVSVTSVSGSPGNYTVVLSLASSAGMAAGHYLKIDDAVPLVHLSGDNSVTRARIAQNELLRTSALLGVITANSGGGSASFASVDAGVLTDYIQNGDLLTIKGQTRVVTSVAGGTVTIAGSWDSGVTNSRDYFLSRPNSGTVGSGGVSSTVVTGSGSLFTTEANVGDLLLVSGVMAVITGISSNVGLTVSPAVTVVNGAPYSIITPAAAHEGTHEILAVSGNQVTVRNTWRGTFAPPIRRVSGGSVKCIRSVLRNTGPGDGLFFTEGGVLAWLNNIVLVGDGISDGSHGLALNGRSPEGPTQTGPTGRLSMGEGSAVVGWGRGAFVGVGCELEAWRSHFTGNQAFGVWVLEAATAALREVVITGTAGTGLQTNAGSSVLFTEGRASGNAGDGLVLYDGSALYAELPFFYGNGGMNVRITGNAGFHINEGALALSGLSGLFSIQGRADLSRVLVVGNARENLELLNGSMVMAEGIWTTGGRGTAGSGLGAYISNSTLLAPSSAFTGNGGGPAHVLGVSGFLDARTGFIRGVGGGGVQVRSQARAALSNGKVEAIAITGASQVLTDGVSPEPVVAGVDRVNEVANDGSLVSDGVATAFGVKAFRIGGNAVLKRLLYASAVLDFPSVAGGGAFQEINVAVLGAITGDVVTITPAATTGNIILSGLVASGGVVTVTARNPTAAAIDPPSMTVGVEVRGYS